MIGLLTFLNQLMSQAPLEKALFLGLSAGISIFLVLLVGDLAVHRILEKVSAVQAEPQMEGAPPTVDPASEPTRAPAPRTDKPARPRNANKKEALAA